MKKKLLIRIRNDSSEIKNNYEEFFKQEHVLIDTFMIKTAAQTIGMLISNEVYLNTVDKNHSITDFFLSKDELLRLNKRFSLTKDDLFYEGSFFGSEIGILDNELSNKPFVILNVSKNFTSETIEEASFDLTETFDIFNSKKISKKTKQKRKDKETLDTKNSNFIESSIRFKGNAIMFPPQMNIGPKVVQYKTENKPITGIVKNENGTYNVYITDKRITTDIIEKESGEILFGRLNKSEIPYKMINVFEKDVNVELGYELQETNDVGNTWVINFKHENPEVLIDGLFKDALAKNIIHENDIDKYYSLFEQYHLSKNMIEAIVKGWEDYGDELNKKIPNLDEAIFIDSQSEEYVKRACAHILGNNNKFPRLRLVGHLSVGKDVLLKTLAVLFHKPMDIVTIFSDTQKEEILGSKTLDENGSIKFLPEPLVKAMENGTWVVFNEINTCDSGILEVLHKVLDSEKAIIVAGYGHIKAKEGFGFFASMNPSDSNYSGTKEMNPATQSRMKTMEIKQQVELHKILMKKYPDANTRDIKTCKALYDIIQNLVINEGYSESFLAVRLYEDAIDSAKWIDIKSALMDIVAHGNTNNSDEIEKIEQIINTKIV